MGSNLYWKGYSPITHTLEQKWRHLSLPPPLHSELSWTWSINNYKSFLCEIGLRRRKRERMATASSSSSSGMVTERRGIPGAQFVEDVQTYLTQAGLDVNSALAFLQERYARYDLLLKPLKWFNLIAGFSIHMFLIDFTNSELCKCLGKKWIFR